MLIGPKYPRYISLSNAELFNGNYEYIVVGVCEFLTEVSCPPFPTWEGTMVNSTLASYHAAVNYTCADNMTLEDGEEWRVATCQEDGWWDPGVVPCAGKI